MHSPPVHGPPEVVPLHLGLQHISNVVMGSTEFRSLSVADPPGLLQKVTLASLTACIKYTGGRLLWGLPQRCIPLYPVRGLHASAVTQAKSLVLVDVHVMQGCGVMLTTGVVCLDAGVEQPCAAQGPAHSLHSGTPHSVVSIRPRTYTVCLLTACIAYVRPELTEGPR